jgi:hypothetical protein
MPAVFQAKLRVVTLRGANEVIVGRWEIVVPLQYPAMINKTSEEVPSFLTVRFMLTGHPGYMRVALYGSMGLMSVTIVSSASVVQFPEPQGTNQITSLYSGFGTQKGYTGLTPKNVSFVKACP